MGIDKEAAEGRGPISLLRRHPRRSGTRFATDVTACPSSREWMRRMAAKER